MEQREKDDLVQKLKWHIYNENFKQIKQFNYSFFKFKMNISKQEYQEAFLEFLDKSDCNLLPWDVCNFFLKRHIKYSINFRYSPKCSIKVNWTIFKTVMFLKKEKLRIYINNLKIEKHFRKKLINKKERYDLSLQLWNLNNNTVYFLQGDSNIWWKPRKIVNSDNKFKGVSYGWLFIQIGKGNFNINKSVEVKDE